MAYDINQCRFSGRLQDVKRINTKTGTPMASFKLQCWKEQVRCVGFKETASQILAFHDGDRVVITGKIQSSNWGKEGTKVYSYQVIVDEIKDDTDQGLENLRKPNIKEAIERRGAPPPNERNTNQYDYQGGPF